MPIRAFVTQNLEQLAVTIAALEKALLNGSLQELRVSGLMTRTGRMDPDDVQRVYQQARYEAYLRAQSLQPDDPNAATLQAKWTNPYVEKTMKVHSRSSVGVFGYPLPAPLTPPTP